MLLAEEGIFLFNIFINELKKEVNTLITFANDSTLVAIANITEDRNNRGKKMGKNKKFNLKKHKFRSEGKNTLCLDKQ